MHIGVPLLKLLKGFAPLCFVRDAQDAVQLLDKCLALHQDSEGLMGHGMRLKTYIAREVGVVLNEQRSIVSTSSVGYNERRKRYSLISML